MTHMMAKESMVWVSGRLVPSHVAEAIKKGDTDALRRFQKNAAKKRKKKKEKRPAGVKKVIAKYWLEILLQVENDALIHAEKNQVGCSEDYNPYDHLRLSPES